MARQKRLTRPLRYQVKHLGLPLPNQARTSPTPMSLRRPYGRMGGVRGVSSAHPKPSIVRRLVVDTSLLSQCGHQPSLERWKDQRPAPRRLESKDRSTVANSTCSWKAPPRDRLSLPPLEAAAGGGRVLVVRGFGKILGWASTSVDFGLPIHDRLVSGTRRPGCYRAPSTDHAWPSAHRGCRPPRVEPHRVQG
jgi:hypothetical protein